MGPSLVEVLGIGIEYSVELLLMQDEQMIETLTAHTSQKPFTAGIRSRGFIRCCEHLDVTRLRYMGEVRPKLAIVITDEALRSFAQSGGDPSLLCYPRIAGRPRHAHVVESCVRVACASEWCVYRRGTLACVIRHGCVPLPIVYLP